MGAADRLIRAIIGEILAILAFFWLGGAWSALVGFLAAALLFTALTGRCRLYPAVGIPAFQAGRPARLAIAVPLLLAVALLPAIGGYVSARTTTAEFFGDCGRLNSALKKAIYGMESGVTRRGQESSLDPWTAEFERFSGKYGRYRPFVAKYDFRLDDDLADIGGLNRQAETRLSENDRLSAGQALRQAEMIWSGTVLRNRWPASRILSAGFRETARSLATAAETGNAPAVLAAYPLAELELREMETVSPDDPGIRGMRSALDGLMEASRQGHPDEMPHFARPFQDWLDSNG